MSAAAWSVLQSAGVPQGSRRGEPGLPRDLRAALEAIASDLGSLDELQLDALHAWLGAFSHHWPTAFAQIAGSVGAALLERLQARRSDPNRYLKLRRIAIAHLAARV